MPSNTQATLDTLTGKAPKASKAPKQAKAQTPAQRKGFTPRDLSKALIAKAKQVWAAYLKDPKAPKVTERSGPFRRGPMLAVAYSWGFTSNADADAKVQAIQTAMGKPLTGPNGTMDFASDSPIKRLKCMGTVISQEWQAKAGKDGVYMLRPTSPQAKKAAQAISAQGVKAPKAKATSKQTKAPKADAQRANGPVKVTVDKALRSAAQRAERSAERAANRAKQAAQGKAPQAASEAPIVGA